VTAKLCNLFEPCESPEAPICPLQQESVAHGIWYANEPICRCKKFQDLSWIKKQKKIASLKLAEDDGYFTVSMLNSLQATAITREIKGADPSYLNAESKWLNQGVRKQAPAPQKRRQAKASSREDLQPQLC